MLNPDNTDFIARRVCKAWAAENNIDFDAIEARIKAIDREMDKIAKAYASAVPAIQNALNAQATDLQTERQQLAEHLAKLHARRPLEVAEIKRYLAQLCVGDPHDAETQKQVIDTFINCVYVWDDKIVIYFNVKDGGQVTLQQAETHLEEFAYTEQSPTNLQTGRTYLVFVGGYIGIVCLRA